MKFTIELSRDERWALLGAIQAKSWKIHSDIEELEELASDWTADQIALLKDADRQLKILAIKIEG
jgi:hypothetical protein